MATVEQVVGVAERGTVAVLAVIALGLAIVAYRLWNKLEAEHAARLADAKANTQALLEMSDKVTATIQTVDKWLTDQKP